MEISFLCEKLEKVTLECQLSFTLWINKCNSNLDDAAELVSERRRQGASWSTGGDARPVSGAELTLIIIIGPQSLVKLKL